MKTGKKGKPITFRPKEDINRRLLDLAEATERTTTYFIDKAMELHLPELEKRFEKELGEYKKQKQLSRKYPDAAPHYLILNEKPNSTAPTKKKKNLAEGLMSDLEKHRKKTKSSGETHTAE
jgi:predicted DNA-binding protein